MTTREENLKKIVAAVEKTFTDNGMEVPSEKIQQFNAKVANVSDEEIAKLASEENLPKLMIELKRNFAAETGEEIKDLDDDAMEKVAGGYDWSDFLQGFRFFTEIFGSKKNNDD